MFSLLQNYFETLPESLYQVTEELKKSNPFEWMHRNNDIIDVINEIIYNDVIFQ